MTKLYIILFFFIVNYSYCLDPKFNYDAYPSDYGMNYKEMYLEFKDISLYMWIVEPINDKNLNSTIILAYGDFGNMSYYLNYIKFYSELGFKIICFDYRGFGKSSPFFIDKNYLFYNEFKQDLEEVVKFSKENFELQSIGLLGLSMGTIFTSLIANEMIFDFIILEGLVVNPSLVAERLNNLMNKNIILPDNVFLFEDIWRNLNCKILIFCSIDDKITTIDDALYVVNYDKKNRYLVSYKGRHLGKFNSEDFNSYHLKVIKFLYGS